MPPSQEAALGVVPPSVAPPSYASAAAALEPGEIEALRQRLAEIEAGWAAQRMEVSRAATGTAAREVQLSRLDAAYAEVAPLQSRLHSLRLSFPEQASFEAEAPAAARLLAETEQFRERHLEAYDELRSAATGNAGAAGAAASRPDELAEVVLHDFSAATATATGVAGNRPYCGS